MSHGKSMLACALALAVSELALIALQALVFVRDLDKGPLAFCVEQCSANRKGPEASAQQDMFKVLSKASNCLVNEVLHLRQLLKRKAADDDYGTPRPNLLNRSDSVCLVLSLNSSTSGVML